MFLIVLKIYEHREIYDVKIQTWISQNTFFVVKI